MKHLAIKTTKKVLAGALLACLAVFLPTIFNYLSESYHVTYYQNADIEHFLSDVVIVVEDMCATDTEQVWWGTRKVGSEVGFPANISRELSIKLLDDEGNVRFSKVAEEGDIDIFIDPTAESSRTQYYDEPLEIGEYQWVISYSRIMLPYGVTRYDIPPTYTNVFEVRECQELLPF